MLHPFRLFYITSVTAFLLVGCASGTNENSSVNQDATSASEVLETEDIINETKMLSLVEKSISEKEAINTSSDTEANQPAEVETLEDQLTDESDEEQNVAMDSVTQMAIEEIVRRANIDQTEHTFMFYNAEDYVEIEIRENKADGSSPMVGRYRYMFDDKKILTMDYLTGDYVLFEPAE